MAAPDANRLANTATIRGTVTDDTGKPAANIPVKLIASQQVSNGGPRKRGPGDSPTGDSAIGAPEASQLQKLPGQLAPGEKIVQTVNTDASGNFSFPSVPAGKYSIIAGAGKAAVRQQLTVKEGEEPEQMKIQLHKA